MVHRKSTYKLTFKNLNADTRKSIWKENVLLRKSRRISEMSHHSLEDSDDDECECDHEDELVKQVKSFSVEDIKNVSKSAIQKRTEIGHLKSHSSEKSKNSDLAEDKTKSQNKTPTNPKILEPTGESSGDNYLKQAFSSSLELSPKSPYIERESISAPEERKYVSEPHLEKLTSNKDRGVLKLSLTTGELDLIPARLHVKGKIESESANKTKLYRRHERNIISVRPRTSILSMPKSSNNAVSNGHVTFLDSDPVISKRELKSTRKEPRIRGSFKEKVLLGDKESSCISCGEEMRKRGILT